MISPQAQAAGDPGQLMMESFRVSSCGRGDPGEVRVLAERKEVAGLGDDENDE